jgi:DNA invertase Pin-like site-specific DNA recombinase
VQFVKEAKVFRGDDTDAMDKLMLSMLGAFAEYERTLIRERQREGIAKAKQRGVYKGSQENAL